MATFPSRAATITAVSPASIARAHRWRPISARSNRAGVARLRLGPFNPQHDHDAPRQETRYTTTTITDRVRVHR
jgi:hypothetical protein